MDEEVLSVPKARIAEAFDLWQKKAGRCDGGSDSRFYEQFRALLRLSFPNARMPSIPNNRKTWHSWRHSCFDKRVQLSKSACQVIFDLSGYAIIDEKLLDHRRNFTSTITITDSPTSKVISNQPHNDGSEVYSISVPRIVFRKSDPIRVKKSWLKHQGESGQVEIGSVVFGVRRAELEIRSAGQVTPRITLLKSGSSGGADVEGLVISDNPRISGRWFIDGEGDQPHLLGSVTLPDLADVVSNPSSDFVLCVLVKADSIEPVFNAIGHDLDRSTAKSRARQHLIEKVLKLAINENSSEFLFAQSKIEKL